VYFSARILPLGVWTTGWFGVLALGLAFIPRRLVLEETQRTEIKWEFVLAVSLFLFGLMVAFASRYVFDLNPTGRLFLSGALMVFAAICYFDVRYLLIPDLYSISLFVLGVFGPLAIPFSQALGGALLCGGLLGLTAWGWRIATGEEGLGWGDIKLSGALGSLLGPEHGIWVIACGALGGAVAGLAALSWRRYRYDEQGDQQLIPFGAALSVAGAAVLVWTRR
jgi:prepilin signal peptidase PulO-like enzyme (type II secretory pathway)